MAGNVRKISRVIQPEYVLEGAGVLLRRSFGPSRTNLFDPFLLFDHFAFNDPLEGPIAGFPMHPHRGIETVTYMLEGNTRHRDSLGNSGVIGPGDVQWMTSGRGILHEEMPRRGPSGRVDGFQLWVNLPAAEKTGPPRYRGVTADEIPSAEHGGATVRMVAGEFNHVTGPVGEITARPIYMDVRLDPGASFDLDVPSGDTALAYVFEGRAHIGPERDYEPVEAVSMVVLGDGDSIHVQAPEAAPARFMFFAGTPFKEPIVPYGPFVMNTEDEIRLALAELRAGTFVKDGPGAA